MKKIYVRAPILTRSGYGEQSRFALRALRSFEDQFDIFLHATNWGQCGWIWEDDEERRWIDSLLEKTINYQRGPDAGKFDISLQITIPNEFEQIAPVNIGYTAGVESTKIAPAWIEKSQLMDRIIVVSNHAKYGFDNTTYTMQNKQTGEVVPDFRCTKPVMVVNYPVRKFDNVDLDLEFDFDFNFLLVAQWSPRKNVKNTIQWFIEEFIDKKVGLVLKLNVRDNSIIDCHLVEKKLKEVLDKYPNRKCSIHLIHGDMTDAEMNSLYQHSKIKALVTLAHGEGFGLPVFEAVCNGLPVIAPFWSGYCDFTFLPKKDKKNKKVKYRPAIAKVDYDLAPIQDAAVWDGVLIKDSQWCFPKQGSFKMKLREVYNEYNRFDHQAKKLQKRVLKEFGQEKQYKQFVEVALGQSMIQTDISDLPKVSIITSVYDGEKYLSGFLKDLERQTIWKNSELILIHPRTSPSFVAEKKILDKFRKKYDNVKYKSLKEDPGVYGCWNKAIKMATGKYLTNCNLDDRRAANCLEQQAKYLFANSEASLVYIDSFITEKPNEIFEKNSSEGKRYKFDAFSIEVLLRGNAPHCNPMWLKSLHEDNGYFSEDYFSCSDWDFWLKCAFAGYKFLKLDKILGLYYNNPKGLSTNKETETKKRRQEMEVFKKFQKRFMAGDYIQ